MRTLEQRLPRVLMPARPAPPLGWRRIVLRAALLLLALPVAFLLGWAAWAGVTWLRYGHAGTAGSPDLLLAPFMPTYDVAERQERIIAASAAETFRAAQTFRLEDSPVVRAIFRGRELMFR